MLSVKKILAGRGAVDYYLKQTRHGMTDYYLPQPDERTDGEGGPRTLTAPGSSWWGGGADALGLAGEVERREFVPLYAKGVRPGGGYLGRKFRQPEEAAAKKAAALLAASEIVDPYDRWMAKHEIRRKGGHASVAAWDCTFSPVKSVSLLWAAGDQQVQQQVWAAHVAAVDAGLGYLEQHAGYVRAGAQGVRVLDTDGLVVARMNEWTSRDGDMHLHTHCVVLNRARTIEDDKWRALDGRALLTARTGAGAIYNRTLEAELTRRLGVAWRDRPDGLRELEGVDDDLIEMFSSRRRAITSKVSELAAAYRDKYGVEAPPAVLSSMAQTAWAATRQRKGEPDAASALEQWEATARSQGRRLEQLPGRVLGRTHATGAAPGAATDEQVGAVLARLADSGRATFSRHDLLRAALDVLPPAGSAPDELRAAAQTLADSVLRQQDLVLVTAADPLDVPDTLRRADGTSVYAQPERERWTLRATLDQERWLLDIAPEPTGKIVPPSTLDRAIRQHGLGDDQAAAVRELLGEDRRVGLLVGPAGAGKTRTLRAVVDAWQQEGGEVLGLTVSQSAAQVLDGEAVVRAENTAKWLWETRAGRWQLPHRPLVLIDEASMVATADLVDLIDQTRRAGGRVLLIGDPAQLAAIHIGGAFDLLADRHGAARLHEIRRFTNAWEANASLLLRRRDPAALAEYAMRARIHGGTTTDIETGLFNAWDADATSLDADGQRRTVLMIVSTNEQAAVLSERARHTLLAAGTVTDGPTVRLRDNVASVGDHLVTRRNNRRLRADDGGWVVNGDLWTITAVHRNGSADAVRHGDGAAVTLPADYLAEHCHLGYATTAHRAQGMTVDVCHAAIAPDASHEQLYVAATRGRYANHLWLSTDADRDIVRDPDDLPAPEEVLSHILARRDVDRLAAHQVIEDSLHEMNSLARLGKIFEDAAREATDDWLAGWLRTRGLGAATADAQWPTLLNAVRSAALHGHDVEVLLDEAIAMRPIDDAHSVASILHWRLTSITETRQPARSAGPLASLPRTDNTAGEIARRAGELIRQRWQHIRANLATTPTPLPWATELGPRPADPSEQSAWLTAATAVSAYRERFEVPTYQSMIGSRPGEGRPEARAAWHHAQLQADRFLARRLRELHEEQLQALDERQLALLARRPNFDPATIADAVDDVDRRLVSTIVGNRAASGSARATDRTEELAAEHHRWSARAREAIDLHRQVEVERARRRSAFGRRPPSVRG